MTHTAQQHTELAHSFWYFGILTASGCLE